MRATRKSGRRQGFYLLLRASREKEVYSRRRWLLSGDATSDEDDRRKELVIKNFLHQRESKFSSVESTEHMRTAETLCNIFY